MHAKAEKTAADGFWRPVGRFSMFCILKATLRPSNAIFGWPNYREKPFIEVKYREKLEKC